MSEPLGGGTPLAARAQGVAPFHVMRILARARELESQGRSILHLEVGEPDFPTPAPAVAAAERALAAGHTQYTPAAGLPALRRAIAERYGRRYGIEVDPARILATPGASGALQLALLALLGPGDGVMLPDPGYPCWRQTARVLGGLPQPVAVGPECGYRLSAELAERAWTPATRAVLVASPANPTGATMTREGLAGLYALCRSRGATLIVDEIYQGLVYGVPDHSALALGEEGLIVVNSLSKYFGMTGWRVGWIVAPGDAVETLSRLAQNLYIAAPTLAQHAACAALESGTEPILEGRRLVFESRRDLLCAGLTGLGFRIAAEPQGAFYLYARLPERIGEDSMAYSRRLLEEAGVAVAPGRDFGELEADRHLRFAYTRPESELTAALGRLAGASRP